MSDIAVGLKFGKAVTDLVSKVFGPSLTERQAIADAQSEVHGALAGRLASHIETFPGDPDVLHAIIECGGKLNLLNLATIIQMAEGQLNEQARPDLIDDDWGAYFKHNARIISDPEVATLWARLLAGEANAPGSFSRKTISILLDMEARDARSFKSVCDLSLIELEEVGEMFMDDRVRTNSFEQVALVPIVLDLKHEMCEMDDITERSMKRLEWLGIIQFDPQGSMRIIHGNTVHWFACDDGLIGISSRETKVGYCTFTLAGRELSKLCMPPQHPDGFIDYILKSWHKDSTSFVTAPREWVPNQWNFLKHPLPDES